MDVLLSFREKRKKNQERKAKCRRNTFVGEKKSYSLSLNQVKERRKSDVDK